jgi:pimeloyl-ACP methyl ester carboxylesterase
MEKGKTMKTTHLCLIVGLSTGLGGCGASTYRTLPSERDIPALRELLEDEEARPVTTMRFETQVGDEPPAKIAIHETGRESPDRIVVLLHGCSSSHQTWRFLAGDLGADHRLVLVDLLGCGMSDCPDPASLGPHGYSPDAMAHRVSQALDAYLETREQQSKITLVGHSLGGAIALRMMGSRELRARYERVASRVDRMVLLSPLDVEFINPPVVLRELANVTPMEIAIGDTTGILRQRVASGIHDSVYDPRQRALREDVDWLCAALTRTNTLLAFQAILRQAVPMNDDRPDWSAIRSIVADYANVDVPCLIVWGRYDETLPESMGFKLTAQIPTAELHVVENCKHSVQLERPILAAKLVREFPWRGTDHVRVPGRVWPGTDTVDTLASIAP